jgi:RNA polymerase subunit RPABC4/transcription elongation factor Spt4
MIPPESGKLGTCFYCKSIVPFNTKICVICENPINPQLQPHATIKLQGKIICTNCTTANPANYATCVACDTKLVPGSGKINEVDLMATVPQHAVPEGKSATCGQCFRLNRADARFCDWCGAKVIRIFLFLHLYLIFFFVRFAKFKTNSFR